MPLSDSRGPRGSSPSDRCLLARAAVAECGARGLPAALLAAVAPCGCGAAWAVGVAAVLPGAVEVPTSSVEDLLMWMGWLSAVGRRGRSGSSGGSGEGGPGEWPHCPCPCCCCCCCARVGVDGCPCCCCWRCCCCASCACCASCWCRLGSSKGSPATGGGRSHACRTPPAAGLGAAQQNPLPNDQAVRSTAPHQQEQRARWPPASKPLTVCDGDVPPARPAAAKRRPCCCCCRRTHPPAAILAHRRRHRGPGVCGGRKRGPVGRHHGRGAHLRQIARVCEAGEQWCVCVGGGGGGAAGLPGPAEPTVRARLRGAAQQARHQRKARRRGWGFLQGEHTTPVLTASSEVRR
jgi:hypothetical protein